MAITKISAVALLVAGAGTGCHAAGGKLMVDTTIVPYHAPDISEITGIDDDDDAGSGSGSATGSGAAAGSAGG